MLAPRVLSQNLANGELHEGLDRLEWTLREGVRAYCKAQVLHHPRRPSLSNKQHIHRHTHTHIHILT
jgi:hypothetical protein